ncbi:MAG: signal recognition particle-docking protein FtsY [Puniceicoccales bacterium]|jgi:fused signal recognition particle receptor|nr:signal recognition particle-docking protein FtsY [Puniceicoccales bacterium]
MWKFFRKLPAEAIKTGRKLCNSIGALLKFDKIDATTIEQVERAFLSADFGTKATRDIIDEIKLAHRSDPSIRKLDALKIAADVLKKSLSCAETELVAIGDKPQVICLVGINGSGKTTVAAKLAHFYKTNGKSVLLAGCDTFRAAACEQIRTWADKLGVDVVGGQPGGDAAAVAYDAYQSALTRKRDVLIIDTAGRLHVKANLMAELQKISKILKKLDGNVQLLNWLVVDGSLGTNSLDSARTFHSEIGLHGLIITKLDGSSRGGTIVGIHRELGVPILFVGIGEKPEDLVRFRASDYIDSLLKLE